MVNLLKNQQFNKLHFLVGKWTKLCEKLQKRDGEIFLPLSFAATKERGKEKWLFVA